MTAETLLQYSKQRWESKITRITKVSTCRKVTDTRHTKDQGGGSSRHQQEQNEPKNPYDLLKEEARLKAESSMNYYDGKAAKKNFIVTTSHKDFSC